MLEDQSKIFSKKTCQIYEQFCDGVKYWKREKKGKKKEKNEHFFLIFQRYFGKSSDI